MKTVEEKKIVKAERAKAWRKANPEKSRATTAAWRAANPEKVKAQLAAYYAANSEKKKAYRAAYYAANLEKAKEYRAKYYLAHSEKLLAYDRMRKYGLSPEAFQLILLRQQNACGICKESFSRPPDVDHCHKTGEVRGAFMWAL